MGDLQEVGHVLQVEPSKALEVRILAVVLMVLVVIIGSLFVLKHQIDATNDQLRITNMHLAQIQHQECLDANAALRQSVAILRTTNPVYRDCR